MPWLPLEQNRPLWYEDVGEGRPLVLIHGWCFSSAVWRYQLDELSRSMRVITLDLPGHGISGGDPAGLSLDTALFAVSHLFRSLDLRDVVLCGWSLGGMVALYAASRIPDRISGLILVGATPKFTTSEDWEYGLTEKDVSSLGVLFRRSPRNAMDSFCSRVFIPSEQKISVGTLSLRTLIDTIPLPSVDVALQGLEILKNTDLRASLQSLDIPTSIVSGSEDSICPPAASRYLAHQLRGELILCNHAGHAPFLTQQALFNEHIKQCIRRLTPSED